MQSPLCWQGPNVQLELGDGVSPVTDGAGVGAGGGTPGGEAAVVGGGGGDAHGWADVASAGRGAGAFALVCALELHRRVFEAAARNFHGRDANAMKQTAEWCEEYSA